MPCENPNENRELTFHPLPVRGGEEIRASGPRLQRRIMKEYVERLAPFSGHECRVSERVENTRRPIHAIFSSTPKVLRHGAFLVICCVAILLDLSTQAADRWT